MTTATNKSATGFFRTFWVIYLALPCMLYVALLVAVKEVNPDTLVLVPDGTSPMKYVHIELGLTVFAILVFVLAFVVPKLLPAGWVTSREVAAQAFLPFIVRLSLLNFVSVAGFFCAWLLNSPQKYLLFFLLTIIGTVATYPSKELFRKLRRQPSS